MKKLTTIFIFLLFLLPILSAQVTCPIGEVSCEYPGDCARYIDADNNNICDYSETETINPIQEKALQNKTYNFFEILIALTILYIITFYLSRTKKIKLITHRKIWNVLLLISFLGTGISGIILVIKMQYGVIANIPTNMLFIHVETGIAMALISIFHIAWHWKYFKRMIVK
jgi:membrane-associated HD superfamily phosphohydrolase